MKYNILLILVLCSLCKAIPQFSTDSAMSYLKTISVEIGARPAGSLNERRAIDFALEKFREFKLDKTYRMNMEVLKNETTGLLENTSSGNAVGVLQGSSDRIIVIGAHIDSESPYVPGAIDNGSGAATVIELARILSKEHLTSTIVFCLFGAEELGLCGSKFFVKNFPEIENVGLMLDVDMANGKKPLIPTIDYASGNTPIWLVQASYEEFNKLGYSGMYYLTHFFTSMSMLPGGGVGSDHEPFIAKKIPAIDFTSDIDDPFHTPQDDFEHFKPSGLKRSGDLIYALVHRFDKNIPEEKTNNYYLLQIGERAIFFPLWLLAGFIIASVLFSIVSLIIVRQRRIEIGKAGKTRAPALKLFLLALTIQTFVWLSENLIGIIKGVRFPWITHPGAYIVLGFLAALTGIAISLRLIPHMKISVDPYRWHLRAVVFLLVFTVLFSLFNVKVTLYPAFGLFFLSLAMVTQKKWLKFLFWIISPHFMFRLFFSEGFDFFARVSAVNSIYPLWMYFALHLFYILFFAIWSFPFLLGFAAIYFDSGANLLWLKKWRTRTGTIIISAAFISFALILLTIRSYSDEWRSAIHFDQNIDLNTGSGEMRLFSSEYLKDIHIRLDNKDTVISTWKRDIIFNKFKYEGDPWIKIDRNFSATRDSLTTFDLIVRLRFKYPPSGFSLTYSSKQGHLEVISGRYITMNSDSSVSFSWKSMPDTIIIIPIKFRVSNTDSVTETIEAKFPKLIEPVLVEKELANIFPQTVLRRTELIKR